MIYFFIKVWIIGFIGFAIFFAIAVNPSFITKYGHTSNVIDNVVRYISILLFLVWVFPHKDLAIDTYGYLSGGSSYIEEERCHVKKTYNSVWFFFAQKGILCENGNRFLDIFTKRSYSKGETLNVTYLPKSTLIIDVKNM